MTTVMLFHGAWHRSACWARLEPELHALGHDTRSPALRSSGDHPTAGMREDAAALAEELASIEGPVVLLGHSYAGIPITEAAAGAGNVVRLIYLAAYGSPALTLRSCHSRAGRPALIDEIARPA